MKKLYIGLVLLAAIWASCHNGSGNMTNKCGPCPLTTANAAILMVAKVRMLNKTTGADLIFATNSPYKPSDLKVSSSLSDTGYHFIVDTSSYSSYPSIWLVDGQSVTYTLQLGNLSTDQIKIVAGLNSQKCCATTEVKSIMLNDSLVCAPCSPQQEVVIKK